MSKNTSSTAFRKLDVDALNEDNYNEDDDAPETPGIGPDENEVNQLLQGSRNQEALLCALKYPPSKSTKDRCTRLLLKALTSFRTPDIGPAVERLDNEQLDLLMKYIYKGFEFPTDNSSAILLVWHEKVFARGGLGCIVRVLTSKKRL